MIGSDCSEEGVVMTRAYTLLLQRTFLLDDVK